MAWWRLYYHIVWSTQERCPTITPEIERELYRYIGAKAGALGCVVHAIGGTADHVHVVASVPPKLAVAEFVQILKGSASYHINHMPSHISGRLVWQRGYGVLSLGEQQLDDTVAYVKAQKQHHRNTTILEALECCNDADISPSVSSDHAARC